MPTERRPSGHGLDDEAAREGRDFIHKAEQDRRVGEKSGLPDSAIEAEQEFEDMVDGKQVGEIFLSAVISSWSKIPVPHLFTS